MQQVVESLYSEILVQECFNGNYHTVDQEIFVGINFRLFNLCLIFITQHYRQKLNHITNFNAYCTIFEEFARSKILALRELRIQRTLGSGSC